MASRLNIVTSVALILSMSVFSIGVPVVLYLCPMMDTGSMCCEIPAGSDDGTHTLTRQPHSCCNLVVGAERNTTPYRIAQSSHGHEFKVVAILDSETSTSQLGIGIDHFPADDVEQNLIKPPLYVLNSSFLI